VADISGGLDILPADRFVGLLGVVITPPWPRSRGLLEQFGCLRPSQKLDHVVNRLESGDELVEHIIQLNKREVSSSWQKQK
jgi:hypothetical protein